MKSLPLLCLWHGFSTCARTSPSASPSISRRGLKTRATGRLDTASFVRQFCNEAVELPVDVVPLAQAHPREEVVAAQPPQLAAREVLGLLVVPVPEVEERDEVRALVAELRVRRVGRLLLVHRPL